MTLSLKVTSGKGLSLAHCRHMNFVDNIDQMEPGSYAFRCDLGGGRHGMLNRRLEVRVTHQVRRLRQRRSWLGSIIICLDRKFPSGLPPAEFSCSILLPV